MGSHVRTSARARPERRRITVRGIVQGVGFRPFVARLASDLGVCGCCGNDDAGVFVEVEGHPHVLDQFTRRLRTDAPRIAAVVDLGSETVPTQGDSHFRIVESVHVAGARTLIPPDTATCADCLRELHDPSDRRYRHPFVNCTNCGPRLTVVTDLPYDRPATTMAKFPMCEACEREYRNPDDRRYHAQPICCHHCGPHLFLEMGGRRIDGDDEVLRRAQHALRGGLTVAVKGIGGFHLVCDATSASAVARLRTRKHRPAKPFAVMARDMSVAARAGRVTAAEGELLRTPARPIVLVRKPERGAVAEEVAPDIDELGLMLPYSPLHQLLFDPVPGDDAPAPPELLVMTSGNLSGEPLCFENADARSRLGDVADMLLMHDRDIAVPCEDSVLAVAEGDPVPIRRSRGFAPLPVLLPSNGPTVLAVGAEVKNTFCLTRQDFAFCSAHLGDMGTLESQRAFERSVRQLTTVHRSVPELVVADEHPDYSTGQWARRFCDQEGIPLRTVQHHHAHVAALLAEHGRLGTRILGVAYDGTGYGCDRTIWGGEVLEVGPAPLDARRVGHLQPFWLPGGDTGVRNPVRVAMSLLHEAGVGDVEDLPCTRALAAAEREMLESQFGSGVGCVRTTSVGRLFDGVSSLLGLRHRISYEAQAAIELETLARSASRPALLTMGVDGDELAFDTLIGGVVEALRAGTDRAALALGFHRALAEATGRLAAGAGARTGVTVVGLTGGVFQNRLLLGLLRQDLRERGFEVLVHARVPANDGGISLGQAVLGRAALAERRPAVVASESPMTSEKPTIGVMT
ncbi:carbamoyltransferase HypF [Rhodococcus sp. NPDC127528]|uniref:carbamoyltransferase HypF n=1 Tax=unclassified Rhodococcus (in: high G+C Gram-positive bacteria) TaxID=192944 RepID=UPI00363A356C